MTDWYDERQSLACLILGLLLEDAGEYDCAATLYARAAELDPRAPAPHVRLGFLSWREEDAAGMYDSFRRAVRLGPLAVREALRDDPEEARLIRLVLYPRQYRLQPEGTALRAPREVEELAERLGRAEADLAAGRDEEALAALEGMLRENPDDLFPVPQLVLAYLLIGAAGGDEERLLAGRGSVLRKIQPHLAALLFRS